MSRNDDPQMAAIDRTDANVDVLAAHTLTGEAAADAVGVDPDVGLTFEQWVVCLLEVRVRAETTPAA